MHEGPWTGEDDVPALDVPAQHDLRRGPADPAGDLCGRGVVEDGAVAIGDHASVAVPCSWSNVRTASALPGTTTTAP